GGGDDRARLPRRGRPGRARRPRPPTAPGPARGRAAPVGADRAAPGACRTRGLARQASPRPAAALRRARRAVLDVPRRRGVPDGAAVACARSPRGRRRHPAAGADRLPQRVPGHRAAARPAGASAAAACARSRRRRAGVLDRPPRRRDARARPCAAAGSAAMNLTGWLTPAPRRRPRPQVRIDLDVGVPAWLVRALAGAVLVAIVPPVVGDWVVPLLAAAALVVLPHLATVAGLTLLAAAVVWAGEPRLVTCAVLVLALHLALVTVRLTGPLGVAGLVDGRLLLRPGATVVVVQLLVQGLVGLSFVAMDGLPRAPWFAVVVLVGIGAALMAALRWVARHTQ